MSKIIVCGVGCCLMDRIYGHVDFSAPAFVRYRSRKPGDGGLEAGRLTFEEDLEAFASRPFPTMLPEITAGAEPDAENIGGPAVVALVHAAQMLGSDAEVRFYGCRGDDAVGEHLQDMLGKTPLDLSHYTVRPGAETPSTTVLSDPAADGGHGERTFVNTIGAAADYRPADAGPSFYEGDVCVFGGTALVPGIHEGLEEMLSEVRRRGGLTVVNTVYDFLNERKDPGRRWPLGGSDAVYPLTDLLIADKEEAFRLSGTDRISDAVDFFREKGVGAVVVTAGSEPVWLWSGDGRLQPAEVQTMPVSIALAKAWERNPRRGDSTGCGDNFAGGVIASVAEQLSAGAGKPNLARACRWGIVSGGFAGLYYGGTWIEIEPGDKRRVLQFYYALYMFQ